MKTVRISDIVHNPCPKCGKGIMQTIRVGDKPMIERGPGNLHVFERCTNCGYERTVLI
jgi:uncharacterized protein (DUF983 family)